MKYFTEDNWSKKREGSNYRDPKTFKIAIHSAFWVILMIIILFQFPLGTVGAGEQGVQLRFNAVTGKVLDEGLYFRIPFIEKIKKMDVKIQKVETEADSSSKDLQIVDSTIALNFHVDPVKVADLYREVGVNFGSRIISPAIQESVKAGMAQFTAEELITKRPEVREAIKFALRDKLGIRGIIVDEFNIVNFNFSDSFDAAIEAKVTAEQSALEAKNKLEQIKFEAEQKITTAKAEAEAIRIQAQAITQQGGKDYVNLQAVSKWNGVLPVQMIPGGTVPFINLSN